MPFRSSLVALLCPLVVLLHGCSEESDGLRLKLVADPMLNSEAQVMAVIDQIQLVLDKKGGFAPAQGEWKTKNHDKDAELELALAREVKRGASALPRYRLQPGSAREASFSIRAIGLVAGEIAAIGSAVDAKFATGESSEVSVPLNLRPRYLPPRVVVSLPHEGEVAVPQALQHVYVEFSKKIAQPTVQGNLRLIYQGTAGERPVPGSWTLDNNSVVDFGLPEERTAATLQLQGRCSLNPGTYRIEAEPGVTDVSGRALDQQPATKEPKAFAASFTVPGNAAAEPCAGTQATCDNTTCDPTGTTGYVCVQTDGGAGGTSGQCVPVPDICSAAVRCPTGYVCDGDTALNTVPAGDGTPSDADAGQTATGSGTCVRDCRTVNDLCANGGCDPNTGLCAPCADASDNNGSPCFSPCGTSAEPCPPGTYCESSAGRCLTCDNQSGCV